MHRPNPGRLCKPDHPGHGHAAVHCEHDGRWDKLRHRRVDQDIVSALPAHARAGRCADDGRGGCNVEPRWTLRGEWTIGGIRASKLTFAVSTRAPFFPLPPARTNHFSSKFLISPNIQSSATLDTYGVGPIPDSIAAHPFEPKMGSPSAPSVSWTSGLDIMA
jgi:hypothetical protein